MRIFNRPDKSVTVILTVADFNFNHEIQEELTIYNFKDTNSIAKGDLVYFTFKSLDYIVQNKKNSKVTTEAEKSIQLKDYEELISLIPSIKGISVDKFLTKN